MNAERWYWRGDVPGIKTNPKHLATVALNDLWKDYANYFNQSRSYRLHVEVADDLSLQGISYK